MADIHALDGAAGGGAAEGSAFKDRADLKRRAMLARLRRRIEGLERRGLFAEGRAGGPAVLPFDIAEIDACLPHRGLALAALHEITCSGGPREPADLSSQAAAVFFSAYLAARASQHRSGGGPVLWICRQLTPHAPGLAISGLALERTIFVRVADDAGALWAMEEALKCRALSAVVAEVRGVGLTASRRLQLAAEAHGVTGLLLRPAHSDFSASAAHSRWRVRSAASAIWTGQGVMQPPPPPALGPQCLRVELLRSRGGGQGQWVLQWSEKTEIEKTDGETDEAGTFHLAAVLAGGPFPARAGTARTGT